VEPVHCAYREAAVNLSCMYHTPKPERLVNAMLISCSRCCVVIPCSSQTPSMQCKCNIQKRKRKSMLRRNAIRNRNPNANPNASLAHSLSSKKECLPIIVHHSWSISFRYPCYAMLCCAKICNNRKVVNAAARAEARGGRSKAGLGKMR
jgi:hypothetical protein